MQQQRRIRGSEVLDDIRAHMSESELRTKYQLSEKGIDSVFRKLASTNLVSQSELFLKYPTYRNRTDGIKQRQTRRADLTVPLPLYDMCSNSLGIVRDISTSGFRVAGIEVDVGETRTFQLPVDMFLHADPLRLRAECTWVQTRGDVKKYAVAGFTIVDLSETDARVLATFINLLILGGSGEWQALK